MLAWQNGGYDATTRYGITIVVWWVVGLGIVLGVLPRARLSTPALVALELGAAYCTWTLLSVFWATSEERVLIEFNRNSMYLGVLTLVFVAVRASDLGRIGDGLAIGIAGVAVVALASRLYPDPFPTRGIPEFLPGTVTRLSFPVGYWNGLAILLAMGVPLLLRAATSWRSSLARGAAIAPLPVIAAVIYLCSSRGGVAAAAVGIIASLLFVDSRWPVVAALGVALAGAAATIYVIHDRPELANGPLGTQTAADQGTSAAVLVAGICLAIGIIFALASHALRGSVRVPRPIGIVVTTVAVSLLALGVLAAHPVARYHAFKEMPATGAITQEDFVNSHLRNGSGTGRWQNWTVAADAWRSAPVVGIGAGGYEEYWAQHSPIDLFVKDAHSLYAEALGELGIVGLALLGGLLGLLAVSCGRRCVRAEGGERAARAALLACGCAFLVAAGIDWMWELSVVGIVGIVALGAGLTTDTVSRPLRPALRLGVALMLLLFVTVASVSLVVEAELRKSREAVAAGDLVEALSYAHAAKQLAPWAASPRLQSALVREQLDELGVSRSEIEEAIRLDPQDWRLWLIRARIETKAGRPALASVSLQRARALNPRSPLFEPRR